MFNYSIGNTNTPYLIFICYYFLLIVFFLMFSMCCTRFTKIKQQSFWLLLCMSLAGIPPLPLFYFKWFVAVKLLCINLPSLVIFLVLNTALLLLYFHFYNVQISKRTLFLGKTTPRVQNRKSPGFVPTRMLQSTYYFIFINILFLWIFPTIMFVV